MNSVKDFLLRLKNFEAVFSEYVCQRRLLSNQTYHFNGNWRGKKQWLWATLHEKCPNSKSPHSVWIQEKTDQKKLRNWDTFYPVLTFNIVGNALINKCMHSQFEDTQFASTTKILRFLEIPRAFKTIVKGQCQIGFCPKNEILWKYRCLKYNKSMSFWAYFFFLDLGPRSSSFYCCWNVLNYHELLVAIASKHKVNSKKNRIRSN